MSICNPNTPQSNCPCDEFVHPQDLKIDAGLMEIPRQIATFPEFRRAMLRAISEYNTLDGWEGNNDQDLGVMLIEMWAYVCDVLSFYDGVIAHESYLRTARLQPSVRKLVDLLGYIPRPATAAKVNLAALASGRQAVTLPKGTVFRSGSFDEEAPQVFELDEETIIHPFANQLQLVRPALTTLGSYHPSTISVLPLTDFKAEQKLLLRNIADSNNAQTSASIVSEVSKYLGDDGQNYTQLSFESSTKFHSNANVNNLKVYQANSEAGLWSRATSTDVISTSSSGWITRLVLDKVYSIRSGDYILVSVEDDLVWAKVSSVAEIEVSPSTTATIRINNSNFNLPTVGTPATKITINGNYALYNLLHVEPATTDVKVHYGMRLAAQVVREPKKTLSAGDSLNLTQKVEEPRENIQPTSFLLQDQNGIGLELNGSLNSSYNALDIPDTSDWTATLYAPVKAYANVIGASRGESVKNEVLGYGDASKPHQKFKLKKKPLTYFLSASLDNDQGVTSSLTIHVDGVEWMEVNSFYLYGPEDQVYIVRRDDEGEFWVTFGDGIRGTRLNSGSSIIANYRFGAGEASPPAGSINQIGKPVIGLQSIKNPVAASGGADAEEQEDVRENGPESVLILGRAVSMKDMEAVAQSIPGVRVAQAEWRWSADAQRPTAHIWYVGDASLAASIEARLRSVTEGNTPFTVQVATKRSVSLKIDVNYDPLYEAEALTSSIQDILMNEDYGFLMPEQQGIGQHFFRSQLVAAVLSITGTTGIRSILWSYDDRTFLPFSHYAKKQNAGSYWDFETFSPTITLQEDTI